MTTVRHETVHYTVEEMAAKIAAEETAKAKKRKTMLVIVGIIAAVIIFGCSSCLLAPRLLPRGSVTSTPRGTVTPTGGYVPKMVTTMANATREASIVPIVSSVPTTTPQPNPTMPPTVTPVPTPSCLTPGDIEHQRNTLTDMQREAYEQEIVGATVCFRGQVSEVYPDGDITLDESSMNWNLARLQGVPYDVGITLHKDQFFEGTGTVTEVSNGFLGLGMSIDIWVTSWGH